MALLRTVSLLSLIGLVQGFTNFVKFDRQPDYRKEDVPMAIILRSTPVDENFRCFELCKKVTSCVSILIRDFRCVMLRSYSSSDGLPTPQEPFPKILHYRIPTVCPPGWYMGGSSCYKLSKSETLNKAVTDCHKHVNASIVTIETAEENSILKLWLSEINTEGIDEFYIGINDCRRNGEFTYAIKNKDQRAPFLDWHYGSVRRQSDCCVVMNKDYNYSWTTSACLKSQTQRRKATICEMNAIRK